MHAIALIPGFLGFDHQGHVTYFADRFVAGLRAAVESLARSSVFVAPLTLPPIGTLAERQRALLAALGRLDDSRGGPFRWHLVGHSTGGLDAAYLARTTRLGYAADRGSFFGTEPLSFDRLASVTTVAAPHYGTCLTRSALPASTRPGASTEERLRGLLELPTFLHDAIQRDALRERIEFARAAPTANSVDFFWHLLFADKLARDLDPRVAGRLTASTDNRRQAAVPFFSIATMAPDPAREPRPAQVDRLFRDLWNWTGLAASGVEPAPPPISPSAWASVERIEGVAGDLPTVVVDPAANDGVVNTNRQVFGTFAGLVSADHGDVLGRYRRRDAFSGETLDTGLLTSGAEFGDDQFFALLRLVARGIAQAISEAAA